MRLGTVVSDDEYEINGVYEADASVALQSVTEEIGLTVTSPPYLGAIDYELSE